MVPVTDTHDTSREWERVLRCTEVALVRNIVILVSFRAWFIIGGLFI